MSSNYVDPDATRPVDLGGCRCPGTPHATDTADCVRLFGVGERGKIRQAGRLGGPEAFKQMAILLGVKRWVLVLPDGSARPINAEQISRLDEATVDRLMQDDALGAAFAEDPLPNASGAPSADGSSASASPAPSPEPTSSTST